MKENKGFCRGGEVPQNFFALAVQLSRLEQLRFEVSKVWGERLWGTVPRERG